MKKLLSLLAFISAGIILSAQVDTTTKIILKDSGEIFTYTEVMPSFPGGTQKYLCENLKCPSSDTNTSSGVRTTYVKFVVEKDGSLSHIYLFKPTGNRLLDAEAIRVISTMPKWSPGLMNGHPVRTEMTQKIIFEIR